MRFLAFVLRSVGCLVLAMGVILAVGDAARSLAAGQVRLMTIADATMILERVSSPDTAEPVPAGGAFVGGTRGDLSGLLGQQPASVVLGLAGIVLMAAGRAPRQRTNGASNRRP